MSPSESRAVTMDKFAKVNDVFWDIKDLSFYLKVKVKTLYAMIHDIPHYRIGKLIRFKKQEIDAWMEKRREKALRGMDRAREIRPKRMRQENSDIDKMISKAIDEGRNEVYNPGHGKSDRTKGLIKEK